MKVDVCEYACGYAGTPMQDNKPPSATDIVRCVATARVTMPRSVVRLSAGRLNFSLTDQVTHLQPLCTLHLETLCTCWRAVQAGRLLLVE